MEDKATREFEIITAEPQQEVVKKTTPKKRKPRQQHRALEELYEIPETKLSENEKITLIKALKEDINLSKNKFEELNNIVDSAFEQNRQLKDNYNEMEAYYVGQLKYINQQLNAFHTAINKATKGA